ncbi:uncharacterized protein E0L32_010140 [Thyridium curvatum]|uniref:mRNA 3'-end-processing protein n=1 Tax=Thyridium curvatum TaxID=1093900 RepID=A0A507AVX1_9PEZI|nr:uncharacterized protein E0L32_010140 [Thyridium curvatum]TPX08410.1 hypothetical protein E0L32_010140 [Thyridium curvatum]
MATSTATTSQLASDMLARKPAHFAFTFTPFLQKTYHHGLPADRPVCKAYSAGHCPNGTRCTERHVSAATAAQGGEQGGKQGGGGFNSLVCKHWLRGLCKKGESCEFLHEYNLRKMPECNFFVRNGYCSNGDECLYLHIDPQSRLPPCPHYDKGFCPLGPNCSKKHVRRRLCPYYLAGFCPDGKACKEGAHPRWEKNLEPPTPKPEPGAVAEGQDAASGAGMPHRRDGLPYDDDDEARDGGRDRGHDRLGGYKDRFGGGGGRGGRWRGRGGHKFRGRGH